MFIKFSLTQKEESKRLCRYFTFRFLKTVAVLFCVGFLFVGVKTVQAVNCGGAVACSCGNTVTSSVVLTADLTCTGHGLVVGANGITIDGQDAVTHINHTITGDGGTSDYGINNSSGFDNIIIQNLTITNFGRGIDLNSTTSSTIQNITANLNVDNGIKLFSSDNNTLTGNTVTNTSVGNGIQITASNTNTLTGNTMTNNRGYGISLAPSTGGNTLTGNIMSGNVAGNFYASGSVASKYNNTIDTTNTVEGKPIYYLYNVSNQTYDGDVVGNIGMFWCISCTNVTVKNATLSAKNETGVFFYNTTGSTIQNITANLNVANGIKLSSSNNNILTGNTTNSNKSYGIYLYIATGNTLTSNTANSNSSYGIYLVVATGNTLTSNTANSNSDDGLYIDTSSNNIFTGNTISDNKIDVFNSGSTNTYSSNQFSRNITSQMLTFVDGTRTKNVGDSISFSMTAKNLDGTACANCTSVSVSPSEASLSYSDNGSGVVTGSFTATKSGTYSLMFTVTDASSNVTKRNMVFFVGTTTSTTTKYYYRDTTPAHGQPYGTGKDSRTLLLTAPSTTETWYCDAWVQNSPDELPNYPLANVTGINTYNWYKQSMASGAYIGIQRYLVYSTAIDTSSSVASAADYTWVNKNFTGLNWSIDYPNNWYWLSLKLYGTSPYQQTTVAQPSYAEFTYSYTTTPAVKSISNDNVLVISATAPVSATTTASIVLENTTSSTASQTVALDSLQRPFTNSTSTIGADGTTSVAASLAANATVTLDAKPMDIVPSSGTVNVAIDTWNTSGNYYKKWTEVASNHDITTNHTVGDLVASSYYNVKKDSVIWNTYQANGSGQITFNYTEGYSTITFEVEQDATAPTISSVSSTPTSSGAAITWTTNENASSKVDYGLTNSYGSSTNDLTLVTSHLPSLSSLVACTAYHYRVRSTDGAGNETIGSDNTFTTTGCTGSATVNSQTAVSITTASGGSVSLLSSGTGIALTVPASFAGSDANFQIKQLDKTATINTTSTPTNYSIIDSYVYDLKALTGTGTTVSTFDKPLTVSINYISSDINSINENSLRIYRYDGAGWNVLSGCTVDITSKTVTCTTSGFSVFALFGQSSSFSTTSSSPSDSNSTPSCDVQSPSGFPNLFLIDISSNKATLYFSPSGSPYDRYYVSYGTSQNAEGYGVEVIQGQSTGALSYSVNFLSPDTKYFFKVRGGNGCKPGSWSNILEAKTKPSIVFNQLEFVSSNLEPVTDKTSNESCQTYIVGFGDTLWSIAVSKLGDGNKYKDIVNQNKQVYPSLGSSNNLKVGWELKLNCGNGSQETIKTTQNLPPPEGYKVKVRVTDTRKKPVQGAKVTIHSKVQEAVTDKDGIATFSNIEVGDHKVLINYSNFQGEQSVNLTGNVKEFNLNVSVKQKAISLSPLAYGIIGLLGLVIVVLIVLLYKARKKVMF